VTPATLPGAPANVVVAPAAPNPGALAVTWSAPATGGSDISSYSASAFAPGTDTVIGGCTSIAVAFDPPATHCTITGLGDGVTAVVRVAASNAVGTGPLSALSEPATTPVLGVATVVGLPTWTVASSFQVGWGATAGTHQPATYQVRYRRSPWNGPIGRLTVWLSGTTATSAAFVPSAGSAYCFSARVVDQAGFPGPWSAERCTTTPLDDRSLSHSGGWTTGTSSADYRGTWSRSSTYGAKLVRTSVRAKQIVLVATSCPTCGTVRVYLGSTLLRTISLYSATTIHRHVYVVKQFSSVRTGTVTVKLSSSGRRVIVDGLGISGI
jgi:hypothetical protein